MSKFDENRIFVLNNPSAPRLCPELAQEIGLHESLILLQLDFWISLNEHWHDGKKWSYQSVRDIQEKFPFMGVATINRAIHSLLDKGLVIEGNYNSNKYDRTRWFAIDFEGCSKLTSISISATWQGHETRHGTRSNQNGTGLNPDGVFQSGTGSNQFGTRSNQFGTRSNQNGTALFQNGTTIPEISSETSSEIPSETTYGEVHGATTLAHADVRDASALPHFLTDDIKLLDELCAEPAACNVESENISLLEVEASNTTASATTGDGIGGAGAMVESLVAPRTVESAADSGEDFNERVLARSAKIYDALVTAGFERMVGQKDADAYERGQGAERVVIRRGFGSWRVFTTTVGMSGKRILVLESQHDTIDQAIEATAKPGRAAAA